MADDDEPADASPRERGYARLINLCDGVVAIAITLLGLPLIDVAAQIGQPGTETVGDLLVANWSRFFAFLLSFAVIAVFWTSHHSFYQRVKDFSPGLIWANMLWLASIVFLPFPTELVAVGRQDQFGGIALYIGTMAVTSVALVIQVLVVKARPALIEGDPATVSVMPSLVIAVSFLVALGLAALLPDIRYTALLVVGASGPVTTVVQRRIAARRGRS